jgi:N-acetylneuraminate synthase
MPGNPKPEGDSFGAIDFGGRMVGPGHPPLIVAEISGNHNGDRARAIELIRRIAATGAEAVKFQTYTADTLTIDCQAPDFLIPKGLWAGRKLYELYQEASTPWEWHEELFAVAREEGLIAFSTPFDVTAIEFLEGFDVPAHKVASFELVDLKLIEAIARTGKPMVISTGLASLEEIEDAIEAARSNGCTEIVLLHCLSAYPTPIAEANLRRIPILRERFGVQTGLSDHTMGLVVPTAAVALGVTLIEKHVTLSRADGGPDAAFSLEMHELAELVEASRNAHAAMGTGSEDRSPSEANSIVFRRSLYVVSDMTAGEAFTAENVRSIRPGHGLAPKHIDAVIGGKASRDIARGTALDWTLVD